jgi:uncharacterized protein (TIRG00374 family)
MPSEKVGNMKKIILSLLISVFFIYLSVKGIDFRGVVEGLAKANYLYVLPFLFIVFVMQLLRAWRWGLILIPLGKVSALSLFAVTNVGFLAIMALPARLGELCRPYLMAHISPIKMPAALGTIFVERIIDGATILIIACIAAFFTPLPHGLIKAILLFFLITFGLLSAVTFAVFRRDAAIDVLIPFVRILPARWEKTFNQAFRHFLDGFGIIAEGKRLSYILLLSFLIWLIDALAIYVLFIAFNFTLPPVAAFVLMIILIIGIALPTAPGFIGNWHYSCVLGLSFFNITKTDALTFAIIYHFFSVAIVVILGLSFLPFVKFSFADLWKQTYSGRHKGARKMNEGEV